MAINWKAKMLEKLEGGGEGFKLFVPRLDIWYHYNRTMSSMPEKYSDKSLEEITDELGIGFHAVIPDYIHGVSVDDIIHRGLGYYNHPDFPFVFDFSDVDFDTNIGEEEITVNYHSSYGDISLRFEYGPEFLKKGVTLPPMKEHPIKEEKDYDVLKEVLSKVKVRERLSGYRDYFNRIGSRGFAVCCTTLACGPVAHIQRDLRRMDDFFLDQYDFPSKIDELAEVISVHYDKMLEIACKTEAEVVILGANYDDMLTIPPLFRKHFMPWLVKAGNMLHEQGKYLLTHTDGENKGLMQSYLESNFDIADSVTPAPMTKLSLKEYRDIFKDKIAIWGGIPSCIMLDESYHWDDFKDWFALMLKESSPYEHLIFSIADTCPPGASMDRIEYLCEQLNR